MFISNQVEYANMKIRMKFNNICLNMFQIRQIRHFPHFTPMDQRKNTDTEENVMAIHLPFITGVGPTELDTILGM